MELDNPFLFGDGRHVESPADWQERRQEIYDLVIGVEYGGLPPIPDSIRFEPLHTHNPKQFGETTYTQYRVIVSEDPLYYFRLDVMIPKSNEPVPCVLTGDGCWKYASDEITRIVIERNIGIAVFSRTELAPDIYSTDRSSGLYTVFPDLSFGALSAWAWGFHRCVDVLDELDSIDSEKIGVVGHSRGGKAALLAGATDERIAVTAPNNSGAGGAGCYKKQGPESETIADTQRMISYWFGPELWQYVGHVDEMPFDQHFLKALVAPRALVSTEGLGDLWSNPTGTYQSHLGAKEVYRYLEVEERIGIWYREGGHNHGVDDWNAFLDFFEWQLRGKLPSTRYNENPFPDMERAFAWKKP